MAISTHNWLLKVKVTLQVAVYRESLCLGVKTLETHDQIFVFLLNSCGNSPYVTSSLMRRWVCFLWICLAFCQVYVSHIEHVTENSSLCTIYKSSVSRGFATQIMPVLHILCYNDSLVIWIVINMTTAKFKTHIFYVWPCLVLYCKPVHSHDFVWLLLVTCKILLYNHIHTDGWKLCANCGTVCTLENFQWCEEPCFVGTAILRGRCQLLIPR
jgi:hypothetical protein